MISMEEVMQTRMKLLSSTALAAAAMVLAAPTAFADANSSLEKRVKALEKASGGMSVTRSKKTMNLVISGHVNRAIAYTDNGSRSGITHVTSNFSRSRVRWIGTGKINDDMSVKTYIELGNQSAIATAQDIGDTADAGNNGANALDERHFDFQITSKSMGKIYMGTGSTGSESTSEVDLSGTGLVSLNGNHELMGGANIFQSNGTDAGLGTVGANFSNFDGLGRRDRLRYDTPKFAGFQVTGSHLNADARDIALRYGGSYGGVKIKAAVAWSDNGNHTETVNGSASVLMPFGLSLTIGAAEVEGDDDVANNNQQWNYYKVGYKFMSTELGQTRLYADINYNEDQGGAGRDSRSYGVGVVQVLEPLGAELFMSYTNWDVDVTGTASDDIDQIAVGARFKF